MKVQKGLFFCWCWMFFVVITKGQRLDTSIYYQVVERDLDEPNALVQVTLKNKKGQILAVCNSLHFDIEDGLHIQAQNSKTTIYLYSSGGQVDSITHPVVNFEYNIDQRILFLEIPRQGNHPPFYINSLQAVELHAKKIEWQIDKQRIYFGHQKAKIRLESLHYFDAPLAEAYQSLGNTNPLVKMALYVQKKGSTKAWFEVKELALLLDKGLENIILMDSVEIEKAKKNPAFKIIKEKQDFEQFKRAYPKVFKFAGINVEDIEGFVKASAIDEKTALPLYLQMFRDGFLIYNKHTKQVQLQAKLFHYVAAMNRQSDYDYDNFKFWSEAVQDTATTSRMYLDLHTQVLVVPKVAQIILGNHQNVIAKPLGSMHLLPKRRLKFNGQIRVGNTCFEGTDFQFEYEPYQVLLPQINRVNLAIYKRVRLKNTWNWEQSSIGRARALNDEGEPTEEMEFIQSAIEEGKGCLSIDYPNNKSGKNAISDTMPIFFSTSKSRVYYDKRLFGNEVVYPRKSFYYELNPFQLNAINQLNIEQLLFKGKFYSSDIFPVIKNNLSLQLSDLSLGFDTMITEANKIPVYLKAPALEKGRFYGKVTLSNAGLIGNGVLTCLGASLGCDVFEFSPNRVDAKQVDSFKLEASALFPNVRAKHIKMLWKPYEHQLYLNSLFTEGFPFHFYYKNKKYRLDGLLLLSSDGLLGRGTLDWKQATMVSNPDGDYQIEGSRIRSESVDILLKISGQDQFGFEQENVRLDLDFDKEKACFKSQDTNSLAVFPYNAYLSTFDQFDWDWKKNVLLMRSKNGQNGIFRREGRSLNFLHFEAARASYDLNTGLLELKKLAPIKIGTAFLYLKDSILEIEADAYIQQLEGKMVLGDSLKPIYVLDSVVLVWNVKTRSFVSEGTSFRLRASKEVPFQLLKGKIEVFPTAKGLLVRYCWWYPNGDWCFLKFEKDVLSAVSNKGAVDGILLGNKEDFESFRARWF